MENIKLDSIFIKEELKLKDEIEAIIMKGKNYTEEDWEKLQRLPSLLEKFKEEVKKQKNEK